MSQKTNPKSWKRKSESLEKNLKIHEENEAYEVCSEIVKAIEYLKSK